MAAGDIYKASEAQTNASQREALAALARGGTAEKDAYLAAQEAQKGDQARIMQEILSRASALGAGEAGAEQQAAAQPGFDRRALALAASQGSASTALDQITKANSNYFDQVNAAVPLVKARSDEINEQNRIKAEREEADRQLALQIKELALMQAEAGLANTMASGSNAAQERAAKAAKAASGGDLSDTELKTRLLGAARATKASTPPRIGNVLGVKIPLPKGSDESVGRRLGVEAGLDPARVFGLLPNPQPKAASPKQATHRTNVTKRVMQHASPATTKAFVEITSLGRSLSEAVSMLNDTSDKELKEDYGSGISRDVLKRWLADYYQV